MNERNENLIKDIEEQTKEIKEEDKIMLPAIIEEQSTEQLLAESGLKVGEYVFTSDLSNKNLAKSLNIGLNTGENGYYFVHPAKKTCPSILQRLTNFTIKPLNKLIIKDFNNTDKNNYLHEIELKTNSSINNMTITASILKNKDRFENVIEGYAHINSVLNKNQQEILAADILSAQCPIVTEYKTAGLNFYEGNQVFITADNYYLYASQNNIYNYNIRLSKKALLQPVFTKFETITADEEIKSNITDCTTEKAVSFLLKLLFDVLAKAYNNRIEVFIAVSMGFMLLFLKQISNDFTGIPVIALYGEAASGKTNILRLIAHAFGLDEKSLHGGMDTLAGLIEDLESYVNIPLLIDEVELSGIDAVKRLIKAVYGQTGRKKYGCKTNINTTLFFNTNHKFLYDLEYKNRCIELNFEQSDFNKYEAEKFNRFQPYLSFISGYIIQNIPYIEIKAMIKAEEQSELLSSVEDNRIQRNMAIALTGFKLLIRLINEPSLYNFEYFEERFKSYIAEVSAMKDDDLTRFNTILKELLNDNNKKIKELVDYRIFTDGLHLSTGKHSKTFELHFKKLFEAHFRRTKPLDMKDYQKLLKQNGAESKSVRYSDNIPSRYGLFLPFDKFEEFKYLLDENKDRCLGYANIENYIPPIKPFCPF